MHKTPFWKRWDLFVPLEPLEELKLEPPESNKTKIVRHKGPTDCDDIVIYKKSKRRRKMYCNCKNCSTNIFTEMKVENEPKPRVEPTNHKYKKESEYDPKGFTELDKSLNISNLKQNKIQNSDEFQRIIDNVAANASYCNEIMKAEMDKLGIQNLTLEESKKVPKLKEDIISGTAKIDKAMKKEHEHRETQRDQVISTEDPKTKNSHNTGKSKNKRLVLILQPDTEENVKPKTNLQRNAELSQRKGNIDNNSSQRFEKEEVDQIMLMFKLMDTRKKYKKMQNEVKLSTTRKEFMDLQMKLLQAKMEMDIMKRQMYCI